MMKTTDLSAQARVALLNTNRCQGAPIPADLDTMAELKAHKLMGAGGGITGAGLIAREALMAQRLDAAF